MLRTSCSSSTTILRRVGVALRDMESVDKDVPLLEALSLKDNYTITEYKFLTNEAYNYQIMHSFMYDFKLGNYLLGPLVDGVEKTPDLPSRGSRSKV